MEIAAPAADETLSGYLDAGGIALVRVDWAGGEHWVLAVEALEQGNYLVLDPLFREVAELRKRYDGFNKWSKLVKLEPLPPLPPLPPPPAPPPPAGGELLTWHIQSYEGAEELDRYFTETRPRYIKLVEGIEQAYHLHGLSPTSKIGYRHCVEHQGQYIYHPDGPNAGARAYIATFRDSLERCAEVVDYIESINEEIPTHDDLKLQAVVRFEVAFCQELERIGYPARPVTCTAGVGNPDHGPETALLVPAVRATIAAGGLLGPHTYTGINALSGRRTMWDGDWEHYGGRPMESWDPTFAEHGLAPSYVFTEGGPIHIAETGNWMNVHGGWQHPMCLNGDVDKLVEVLLEMRRRILVWNAGHGDRVLGLCLFTVYGFGWYEFQYPPEVVRRVREALA